MDPRIVVKHRDTGRSRETLGEVPGVLRRVVGLTGLEDLLGVLTHASQVHVYCLSLEDPLGLLCSMKWQ